MTYEFENADKPKLNMPAGACDTHMHIYEPQYAMAPSALLEPMENGQLVDYRKMQERLGLERTVIVQPSTYGADNTCTLEAMAKLGNRARGVVVVEPSVTDAELEDLTSKGARGIRFFMFPGGALSWDNLEEMAARVHNFGWHVQMQLKGSELPDRLDLLKRLPGELVIDHIGRMQEPITTDNAGFKALLDLVERGCWVKLSAPYLSSQTGSPSFEDTSILARTLIKTAPEHMVWASNWPHPDQDPRPDDAELIDLLLNWADDDRTRQKILSENPAKLYGFE